MKHAVKISLLKLATLIGIISLLSSCQKEDLVPLKDLLNPRQDSTGNGNGNGSNPATGSGAILLIIDEESIDNGNAPNNFSAADVNDQLAKVGQRTTLRYFQQQVGKTITLYTGEVGDEAWFAIKTIPQNWKTAGPTSNGARNYVEAGPGLGGGNDDREVRLDKIPNITPLRATGLKMLIGQTILAVVYDSDISINYGPLNGNLQGANLGLVAFKVLEVNRRTNGSSGSLPMVKISIQSVQSYKSGPFKLFSNAPAPRSSSEPFDINPPAGNTSIVLTTAP